VTLGVTEMGWGTIIRMHSQLNEVTLLGKKIADDSWQFKWDLSNQEMEREFEVTITSYNQDVDITLQPYSTIVTNIHEAINIADCFTHVPISVHKDFRERVWQIIHSFSEISFARKLKWFKVCFPEKKEVVDVAKLMVQSQNTIVIIGNYSDVNHTDSKGIWKFVNENNISSKQTFNNDYEIFRKYVSHKVKKLERNNALTLFNTLANLEKGKLVSTIVFHCASTSQCKEKLKNVIDLKGTLNEFYCNECGASSSERDFFKNNRCFSCDGKIRPAITLEGEDPNFEAVQKVEDVIKKSELILCINCDSTNEQLSMLLKNERKKVVSISQWQNKYSSSSITITSNPKDFLHDLANLLR
jgi:NAD-dependent SIR2 family protein deacetylase